MSDYVHQQTKHSYASVRKNTQFLDWNTQPRTYKQYPHFFPRFQFKSYEEIKEFELLDSITYEQEYHSGSYFLRTTPSAGALYPYELYIQIRGIKGLINGIYHYDVKKGCIALLREIEKDGVEAFFTDKHKQKGFIFLISSVYFRSSWKYHERAIRYILLDVGHQLGSVYNTMQAMHRECQFSFEFDKDGLNRFFSLREDEMFVCAAISAEKTDKETVLPKGVIPYVAPCDYLEENEFVYNAYLQTKDFSQPELCVEPLYSNVSTDELYRAILERRSIRVFYQKPMDECEFKNIVAGLFELAQQYNIELFYTVHSVDGLQMGLYKGKTIVKEGDFREKSRYLALEQNIGGQSGVTFYFTSNEVERYQFVNIMSGFIAQVIYIRSQLQHIGCSGIGAYYDDEVKEFLQTKNNILYLLAIGR